MEKITYHIKRGEWAFDDYGHEYWHDMSRDAEAKLINSRAINYCDGKGVYYAADCSEEEAIRIAEEFNSKREHMFSPSMDVQSAPLGMIFVVTYPYDD